MINKNDLENMKMKKLSFPGKIRYLENIGIERYQVDLYKMEITYYSEQAEFYVEPIVLDNIPCHGKHFDQGALVNAIRINQEGKSDYPTFLREIIIAGITNYMTYIIGKKVVYFGRNGEFHAEEFNF